MKTQCKSKTKRDPREEFRQHALIRAGLLLFFGGWFLCAALPFILDLVAIDISFPVETAQLMLFASGCFGFMLIPIGCHLINCKSKDSGAAYISPSRFGLSESESYFYATAGNLVLVMLGLAGLIFVLIAF